MPTYVIPTGDSDDPFTDIHNNANPPDPLILAWYKAGKPGPQEDKAVEVDFRLQDSSLYVRVVKHNSSRVHKHPWIISPERLKILKALYAGDYFRPDNMFSRDLKALKGVIDLTNRAEEVAQAVLYAFDIYFSDSQNRNQAA